MFLKAISSLDMGYKNTVRLQLHAASDLLNGRSGAVFYINVFGVSALAVDHMIYGGIIYV